MPFLNASIDWSTDESMCKHNFTVVLAGGAATFKYIVRFIPT